MATKLPPNFSRACTLLLQFGRNETDTWEDLDAMDGSGECGPLVAKGLKWSATETIRRVKGLTKLSWPRFKQLVTKATSEKYLHRTGLIARVEQAAAYNTQPGW